MGWGNAFSGDVAEKYDEWFRSGFGRKIFDLEVFLFKKRFPRDSFRVLDVGCGTGIWMDVLGSMGHMVFGVDCSLDMLRIAAKKGLTGIVNAKAEFLPFLDDCFEVVLFSTSLEFVEDKEKALKEALRIATKYVVVCFLNRWSLLAMKRRLKSLFSSSIYRSAEFLTSRSLLKMAESIKYGSKHLDFCGSYGIGRLVAGRCFHPDLEKRLPDVLPFSMWKMVVFEVVYHG